MAVSEGGSEGEPGIDLSPEEYQWLQEQLQHVTTLEVEDEDEDEWADPSDGLLSEIFGACEGGMVEDLEVLLSQLKDTDFSIDTPGPDGDTALHLACLYGNLPCVEVLLKHGSDPAAVNPEDGSTVLHDAAAGGYLDIVELLTASSGALVSAQDADGDTPLHNAARGNHPQVVKCLLSKGANPSTRNVAGRTPAEECDDQEIQGLLAAVDAAPEGDTASAAAAAADGS